MVEQMKKAKQMEEHNKTLFAIVWGQCTDALRQKIEALDNYENMSRDSDGIELLKTIRNTVYNFQSQRNRLETSDGVSSNATYEHPRLL